MQTTLRSRFMRMVCAVMVGGSAMQLSGCDGEVRATLLDGLEATSTSLSAALISAFFLTLQEEEDDGSLTTT